MNTKGTYHNKKTNKYCAQYYNKELERTIYIGSFDTLQEAEDARNKHVTAVFDGLIDDSLPKTHGLPKGITMQSTGSYAAGLQFIYGKDNSKHLKAHIGTYLTIEEAVEARKQFILKLL